MEKIQKFGGAMFTPVMLFAVSAVLIGFGILFTNEQILGAIAAEGTFWRGFWDMVLSGGWTVLINCHFYLQFRCQSVLQINKMLELVWNHWLYI